jgi:outer membrane protein assembly factor BamD (BamD/ComL family)
MAIMDNFWVKAAIVVVVAVAVFVAINKYKGSKKQEPAKPDKTVEDMWREDEKRLRAEPNVAPATEAAQSKPIQFKELTEEQRAGAEQLFEWAIKCREMARLPGAGGYVRMVEACRNIIERYPGSEFDYKARRMLGEVPRDQWERYKITEKEITFPQ